MFGVAGIHAGVGMVVQPMTDNLRDRIIAAIAQADQDWCSDTPLHEDMADAVIAELGLRTEWGLLDHTDSGLICDTLEDADARKPLTGERLCSRLVTDWINVETG